MKLIQGATIYTMNEKNEVLKDFDVLMKNGKILEIGRHLHVGNGVEVIPAQGYILTPGLIDAHTHVGIWGEMVNGINAGNESSRPLTPQMSAVDGFGPHHDSFEDARSGGVTAVQTGSGSNNVIGGVWSVVKTAGNTVEEMILTKRSGLKGALGENPKLRHGQQMKRAPFTRMAIAKLIREEFKKAQAVIAEGKEDIQSLHASGNEALLPFIEVLNRKMPLRLHAHRADDIVTAIRIAKEFDVDLTIEHCTEGHQIVDYIKESGFPITVGPFMGQPNKPETKNINQKSPAIFHEAGILFAINTDHPVNPIQYLSVAAADAVKNGLNEMAALQAITINPAIILGVQDRVGSIEMGKDADVVLWSAHPFQSKANVLYTFVNGKIVYQNNRALSVCNKVYPNKITVS